MEEIGKSPLADKIAIGEIRRASITGKATDDEVRKIIRDKVNYEFNTWDSYMS